jgi:hypothetical protein
MQKYNMLFHCLGALIKKELNIPKSAEMEGGGTDNVRDNEDCIHPKQPEYSSLSALPTQELVCETGLLSGAAECLESQAIGS